MGIVTPQSCSVVALASLFPALPVTCGNELQEYSWERYTNSTHRLQIYHHPGVLPRYFLRAGLLGCASSPLFSVLLGVEIMKSRGSTAWPVSVKGVVSCRLVTRLWVLENGRHTCQIFHWHTSGKGSYLER